MLPALHVARHAPKTEALLEQRLQFRQARIADRKDLRLVGPNPAMMERRKIVASKLLNDSGVAGSCEGHAVGMLVHDRKSTRLNSRHSCAPRTPSSASHEKGTTYRNKHVPKGT